MTTIFLIIEILVPLLAIYFIWLKGDLSIVYLPFFFFCNDVVEKNLPAVLGYVLFSAIILFYIYSNPTFAKNNPFAIALLLYFTFLLQFSKDLVEIRPYFFGVAWIFILVPLIVEVYKKYSREKILREIEKVAFLVLLLFVLNSIFSTLLNYNPREQYGITSGILYGGLSLDNLNILPFAVFVVIRKGIKDRNVLFLLLYLTAIFFILLTFRRSVMALCVLGTFVVMIELLNAKQIGDFLIYGLIIGIASVFVVYYTGFMDLFWERYNMRGLDNRPIEEELRIVELYLIYKDLFVHYDYDPWFGYELFASNGNYGKGVLRNRSLHTDLASIIHSSGLIGFGLYFLMISTAFRMVWNRIKTKHEYFHFFFYLIVFLIFFINGRYTTVSSMTMMFCLLYLPLSKNVQRNHPMKIDYKRNYYNILA